MPITTGSFPKALTGKMKKPKKASLPKPKASVRKPKKPSIKVGVPTVALDKFLK